MAILKLQTSALRLFFIPYRGWCWLHLLRSDLSGTIRLMKLRCLNAKHGDKCSADHRKTGILCSFDFECSQEPSKFMAKTITFATVVYSLRDAYDKKHCYEISPTATQLQEQFVHQIHNKWKLDAGQKPNF